MAVYHLKKGSVNYTVVGSPTIVDGVVSGTLNNSNYLTLDSLSLYNNDIEIISKVKPGTGNAGGNLFAIGNGRYIFIRFNVTSLILFSNGTQPAIELMGLSLDPNRFYFIKIKKENNITTIGYSEDNITWQESSAKDLTYNPTAGDFTIGVARYQWTSGYNGAGIDLNHTYIKVNGLPWFGVCPLEVQQHQLMGPVGYTEVGSPTITAGEASGFSSGSYLQMASILDTSKNWEFVCKFSNTTSRYKSVILGSTSPYGIQVSVSYGTRLFIFMSSNGSSWNVRNGAYGPANSLSLGNNYYVKIVYSTTDGYTFYLSSDGVSWEENYRYGATPVLYNSNTYLTLGRDASNDFLGGSIDLNETYIKVNGKLWYWQPRGTEWIVANGVEVWRKEL